MHIQIIKHPGLFLGSRWYFPGDIVELPDDRARQIVRDGYALVVARADMVAVRPADEYATAPPAREAAVKRRRKAEG